MSVQEQTPFIECDCNGVTKVFPLNFDCHDSDHLIVKLDDIDSLSYEWVLSGESIVFHTAPKVGSKLSIQRNTPLERLTNYSSYDNSMRPQVFNNDFDRIWYKLQELGLADWLIGLRLDKEIEDRIAADIYYYTLITKETDYKINELKKYIEKHIYESDQNFIDLKNYIDSVVNGVVGENFLPIGDQFILTEHQRTLREKNGDFISLHDYCKLNGSDETNSFEIAVHVARSSGKKLISYSGRIQISRDMSLRNLDFDLSSTIIILNDCTITVGQHGGNSFQKKQSLGLVFQGPVFSIVDKELKKVSVRMLGSKCFSFHFDQIDYLQLYVSTDPSTFPNDASIGYCTVTGKLLTRLEFETDPRYKDGPKEDGPSSANQWINSNQFHINRLIAIDMRGSYSHNGNTFYGPTLESFNTVPATARINLEVGSKNKFTNIRGENYPMIFFGPNTYGNIVERVYFGSLYTYLTYKNVTDTGLLNRVTSVQENNSFLIPVISMDAKTDTIFNGQALSNYQSISPSRKMLKTVDASKILSETRPFLINKSDVLQFSCNNIINQMSARYNARVYLYDKDMKPCKNININWVESISFKTVNMENSFIEGTFISDSPSVFALSAIGRESVRYFSVMLLTSSSLELSISSQINISLLTMRNILDQPTTHVLLSNYAKVVSTKPTKFLGQIGDVVIGSTSSWRCSFSLETTLTNDANKNGNSIIVETSYLSGFGAAIAGDLIGIELVNNITYWTSIKSVEGNNIIIQDNLPSNALRGGEIYISRLI